MADGHATYRVWLRRRSASDPSWDGKDHDIELTEVGNAAARETLVTATPHLAIWTNLFREMIADGCDLRWRERGPGTGRDARIAYSSLMGRYIARAYLTAHEGVHTLVPLDVAKGRLRKNCYRIVGDSRAFLADWIGLDSTGLVIVEAKGTFNNGIRKWRDAADPPSLLRNARRQTGRTVVLDPCGREIPAKRWAVVSRWGTEENKREPTIMAWCDDHPERGHDNDGAAESRHGRSALRLKQILLEADLNSVVTGLGHGDHSDAESLAGLPQDRYLNRRLLVDGLELDSGLAAAVGPFGVQPLLGQADLMLVNRVRDRLPQTALVSLSSDYITDVQGSLRDPAQDDDTVSSSSDYIADGQGEIEDRDGRDTLSKWQDYKRLSKGLPRSAPASMQAGLSVCWPHRGQRVEFAEDIR